LLLFGAESFVSSMLSKNIKIKIHRNIILPIVLYACETWSFTLREEIRMRFLGNRAEENIWILEGRNNRYLCVGCSSGHSFKFLTNKELCHNICEMYLLIYSYNIHSTDTPDTRVTGIRYILQVSRQF